MKSFKIGAWYALGILLKGHKDCSVFHYSVHKKCIKASSMNLAGLATKERMVTLW